MSPGDSEWSLETEIVEPEKNNEQEKDNDNKEEIEEKPKEDSEEKEEDVDWGTLEKEAKEQEQANEKDFPLLPVIFSGVLLVVGMFTIFKKLKEGRK